MRELICFGVVRCGLATALLSCLIGASTVGIAAVAGEQRAGGETGEGFGAYTEHKEERKWYSWFWPIGDRVEVETLSDEYVPFKTEVDQTNSVEEVLSGAAKKTPGQGTDFANVDNLELLPPRPSLAIEVGDGFLDTGQLDAGFEVPLLGAVWQPRLWAYGINRTAYQNFKDGRSGNRREVEIANRQDLFFNLQLTGTEKILLGLRTTDRNSPDRFTRYTFSGQEPGYNDELNVGLETLFFEGDVGSLFPFLDQPGFMPIDYGFTVGAPAGHLPGRYFDQRHDRCRRTDKK